MRLAFDRNRLSVDRPLTAADEFGIFDQVMRDGARPVSAEEERV